MTRFITLKNNIVMAVRYGKESVSGEIPSDKGEIGQIYDPATKTFSTPVAAAEAPIDVAKTLQEIQTHYVESALLLDKIKQALKIT